MKANKKVKILILSIVFLSGVLSVITFKNSNNADLIRNYNNPISYRTDSIVNLRKANYWTPNFIHISNDNWSATDVDWIQNRTGTWDDPHVIENVTIDASSSPTDCGILIENSNDYFIIRNCTVFNAPTDSWDAGIKLYNTNNGLITNNNCSDNGQIGILLYQNCDNNTISENIVSANTVQQKYGIRVYLDCNDNLISGNIASGNQFQGIELNNCDNNTISGNLASNTTNYNQNNGICLSSGSDNNIVKENIGSNNLFEGIYIVGNCRENIISENKLYNDGTSNQYDGIGIESNCDNNTISKNLLKNNQLYGIFICDADCENNSIYQNSFIGNVASQARDEGTDNQWDNGAYGNYWDNHTSPDSDDDKIVDIPYTWIYGSANSVDNYPLVLNPAFIGEVIQIDGSSASAWNWSKTSEYFTWCSGKGSYNDPYVIEGLEINGTNSGSCIQIANSSAYFTIKNCNLYNAGTASSDASIKLENTNNGTLINNNCSNNGNTGLLLYNSCENNTLSENIANYNAWYGIRLNDNSCNNTISNNRVNNNDYFGIQITSSSANNTVSGNTACDNNNGIFLSTFSEYNVISENTVCNNADNGIGLSNCGNNKILGNNVSNNPEEGIYVGFVTHDNLISGNIVKNNLEGIELRKAKGNIIRENILYNNSQYGIYVVDTSWYNKIIKNSISNSSEHGISIVQAGNNTISQNTIENSTQYGIFLGDASNNTLSGNSVRNNLLHGIQIQGYSDKNNITSNKVSKNFQDGISLYNQCDNNTISENLVYANLGYGIKLEDQCRESKIHNNNITNNPKDGIYLFNQCGDNTIYSNNISYNLENGIRLYASCYNNNLTDNNLSKNYKSGLYLYSNCDSNTISRNKAMNNTQNGLSIENQCDENNITENIALYNDINGFYLDGNCNFNLISNNYFSYNQYSGMNLTNSLSRNQIHQNEASYNRKSGLVLTLCDIPNTIYYNIMHNNSYSGIQIVDSQDISIIENELSYNYYGILLKNTYYSNIFRNLLISNNKSIVEDSFCYQNFIKDNEEVKKLFVKVNAEYFTKKRFSVDICITDKEGLGIENVLLQVMWDQAQIQSDNITEIGNGYYNISLTPIFIKDGDAPILLNISGVKPNYLSVNYEYEIAQYYDNDMEIEILHEGFSAENFTISIYVKNSTGDKLENVNIRAWWNGSEDLVEEYYYGNGVHYVVLEPIFVENASDYLQSIMLNMTISQPGYNDLYFETRIGVENALMMNIIDEFYSESIFNITFMVFDSKDTLISNANIQLWWNGIDNTANITNLGSGLYRVSLNPILVSPGDDPILLNMTVSASGYSEKYYELDLAVDPEAVDKSTEQPPDDDNDDTSDKDDDKDKDTTKEDEGEVSGGISYGWYFLPIIAVAGVILYASKRHQLNSR